MENIILKDVLDLGFNGVTLAICAILWRRLTQVTDMLIEIAQIAKTNAVEARRSTGQEETD